MRSKLKLALSSNWLDTLDLDGARTNAWDVAFLVMEQSRAAEADFTPPFMQSDFTYLVRPGSTIRSVADVDQAGVRIVVPRGDASELYLTRTIKRAELVRTESITAAVDLLRTGNGDAYAGPPPNALDEAIRLPGSRVLEDASGSSTVQRWSQKGMLNTPVQRRPDGYADSLSREI